MSRTKTIILFIIIINAIIIVLGYVSIREYSFHGNRIKKIVLGNENFYSEVVSSPSRMYRGLGGRNDLCQSCAMLFQFSDSGKHSFWMKNMLFPLDIIWLLNDKIVHLEKNVPKDFSGIMMPSDKADQVLEINAGNIERLGIKIGDKMEE